MKLYWTNKVVKLEIQYKLGHQIQIRKILFQKNQLVYLTLQIIIKIHQYLTIILSCKQIIKKIIYFQNQQKSKILLLK